MEQPCEIKDNKELGLLGNLFCFSEIEENFFSYFETGRMIELSNNTFYKIF